MTPTITIIMAAYNAGTSIGSPEVGAEKGGPSLSLPLTQGEVAAGAAGEGYTATAGCLRGQMSSKGEGNRKEM